MRRGTAPQGCCTCPPSPTASSHVGDTLGNKYDDDLKRNYGGFSCAMRFEMWCSATREEYAMEGKLDKLS